MSATQLEKRFAHDVFDTMFPSGAHALLPDGLGAQDAGPILDEVLATWPRVPGLLVRLAIVAIALSPVVTIGRLRTLGSLPREDRVRVLDKLSKSSIYPVRSLVTMLKAIAGMFYGALPSVRRALSPGGSDPRVPSVLKLTHRPVEARPS